MVFHKAAAADGNYVRLIIREAGITRRMFTYESITQADLDEQAGRLSEVPIKLVSLEIPTMPAMTVPFEGTAPAFFIRTRNAPVVLQRVESRELRLNSDTLLAVKKFDPRQVALDHMARDVYDEEDRVFIQECLGEALGTTVNVASPYTNQVQWKSLAGGWTRANLRKMHTLISEFGRGFRATRILSEDSTVYNFMDWGHDEAGGETSERILRGDSINGYLSENGALLFSQWFLTIKSDLVPKDTLFEFIPEENYARFYELQASTAIVKRDGQHIQARLSGMIGGAIVNPLGHCRVDIPTA